MQEQHCITPPVDAAEVLLRNLKPASRKAYIKAFNAFEKWAHQNNRRLATTTDFDVALYEYIGGLRKSQGENTLAALEKVYPPLRGRIPWARARLHGIAQAHDVAHHPPMPWMIAVGIAWGMLMLNEPRAGIAFLVMRGLGLRPSEAIGLSGDDISVP